MRTPDEIKKGLECCGIEHKCEICPYKEAGCLDLELEADALAYIEQLECKAKPITCGECEYYGKSPMGSMLGWCRLDCTHRSPGFWCANADRRANK